MDEEVRDFSGIYAAGSWKRHHDRNDPVSCRFVYRSRYPPVSRIGCNGGSGGSGSSEHGHEHGPDRSRSFHDGTALPGRESQKNSVVRMVPPVGLEPTCPTFVAWSVIQLRDGGPFLLLEPAL